MVYVLNIDGKPLMPTTRHGKVRRMLKSGYASVAQREPFTIRLNYENSEFIQPVNLGVDAGSKYIGVSATTEEKELFAAEVHLRTDIVELIATRKAWRHERRRRKTRHREMRIQNRRKKFNRFSPSIENRIQTHIRVIKNVCNILPIAVISIEVGQFDNQLLQCNNIHGEQYQIGLLTNFWNIREYVFYRDNHTCQYCKGKSGDKILNVHHIEGRKTGSNSPDNLITLCKSCHSLFHQGCINLKVPKKQSLRDVAAMNVMRWELYKRVRDFHQKTYYTFGYFTKNTRIQNGLEKTHVADARCISGNPRAERALSYYYIRQIRRHNRQIHKYNPIKGGKRKLNQSPYELFGFRLFDKVSYENKICFIFGRRKTGYFDIRLLDGTKVRENTNYKKLKLIEKTHRLLIEKRDIPVNV